jgi:hypothetical protein
MNDFIEERFFLNLALLFRPCQPSKRTLQSSSSMLAFRMRIIGGVQTRSFENLPVHNPKDSVTSRLRLRRNDRTFPAKEFISGLPTFGFPMIFTKPAL